MQKYILLILLLPNLCLAEQAEKNDPCASLLAVLNRPTVADSVCVVKPGTVVIEAGYEYQDLYPDEGHQSNFPEIDLRIGLPGLNEISVLLPNHITSSGSTATVLQAKHQFLPDSPWIYAVEGFLTLPTGDADFGSAGFGYTFNTIIQYNFTPTLGAAITLGGSSATAPSNSGGGRYGSFNPDLVIAWQCREDLQLYTEFYGQTKIGPGQSDGYNSDAGVQYLITDYIEIDLEYGQRLSGELGGFARYIGAGAGVRF